jgi:hypothetical protein
MTMKVKALRNLGGVVTAIVGQEVEVTEAQALDLINQGVAEPVNANEYMTLKSMTSDELAKVREDGVMARKEFQNAVAEEAQRAVNQEADQLEQKRVQAKAQAQTQAQSHAQNMHQQAQTVKQAQQQAEKAQAEAQVKTTTFKSQAHQSATQAQAQTKQDNQ